MYGMCFLSDWLLTHVSWENTDATNGATTQRVLDAIITSLWRRNDVATSFPRHNDVIFASCVRWALTDNTVVVSTNSDLDDPMMNGVQKHQFGRDDPALSSEHLQDVVRIPLRPQPGGCHRHCRHLKRPICGVVRFKSGPLAVFTFQAQRARNVKAARGQIWIIYIYTYIYILYASPILNEYVLWQWKLVWGNVQCIFNLNDLSKLRWRMS